MGLQSEINKSVFFRPASDGAVSAILWLFDVAKKQNGMAAQEIEYFEAEAARRLSQMTQTAGEYFASNTNERSTSSDRLPASSLKFGLRSDAADWPSDSEGLVSDLTKAEAAAGNNLDCGNTGNLNLWHLALTKTLVGMENIFTLACERGELARIGENILSVVKEELKKYRALYSLDFDNDFPWLPDRSKEMLKSFDCCPSQQDTPIFNSYGISNSSGIQRTGEKSVNLNTQPPENNSAGFANNTIKSNYIEASSEKKTASLLQSDEETTAETARDANGNIREIAGLTKSGVETTEESAKEMLKCKKFNPCTLISLSYELAGAGSDAEFFEILTEFYSNCGTGKFALSRAFKLITPAGASGSGGAAASIGGARSSGGISDSGSFTLAPIASLDSVRLNDLVGYEIQKEQLKANTEAFLSGLPANNVLLYGDSGSGKSTSIRALLNEYKDKKLRLIELQKYQFSCLPNLIAGLSGRGLKFILFIDDLSFEDFETEYKFLKSVIDGGMEAKPSNVLIYATSNRRHLIRETWSDRKDMEHEGDVHRSDTLEEKLSLAGRFGLSINFSSPTVKEYHEIVRQLAAWAGIKISEPELYKLADAWEIRHGGRSGRCARQFVDNLSVTLKAQGHL